MRRQWAGESYQLSPLYARDCFRRSAAAGYDLEFYSAIDRHWLVRGTDIEILRPLRYGDSVQVKTWVVDFQRVRSRRVYELSLPDREILVADACTEWAFLDSVTGRPAPIPSEMIAAFFPDGPPEVVPPRSRFPVAPEPPSGVFRLRRRVEWRDVDAAGHVNNAVYMAYMEDCGLRAIEARGWPPARLQAEGLAILARRHQVEYRQPALLNEGLEITTWLSEAKGAGAVRHYTVNRLEGGALLAQAHTRLEWIDAKTQQPIPIPNKVLEDLTPNISRPE